MKGHRYILENLAPKRRIAILLAIVLFIFTLLVSRLWYLQILKGDDFISMSESNRLRTVPVAASRGVILDRNGAVLVSNKPSFSVAVIPQEVQSRDLLLARLSSVLAIDLAELKEKWDKGKGRAKYVPIILMSGISRDQLERLEENRLSLPGLDLAMKPIRDYPQGMLASHLLGYLGEISESELDRKDFNGYNPGDYIGKSGLERSWERYLHGSDGGRQVEVDARGRVLRTIAEKAPDVGDSLALTIDMTIQRKAEEAFGNQAGAAVLLDVTTGEVLAFVSNPGFDPSHFTGRMTPEQWQEYLDDKRHPLENKALKGLYPPGSTFKIITAFAGLEERLIDENTTIVCRGSYTVGTSVFKCWDKHGHGPVNLKRALKESCDVYFYQLGERLGIDRIASYAGKFALGAPFGIGLENEKGGLIPTTAWKEKKTGKKWYRGDTLSAAIGQGYVAMTPIQLASMIGTIANEGTVYRPHLIKQIIDRDGKVLKEYKPEVMTIVRASSPTFRLIKEGLLAVVNEPRGTGSLARLYEVKVAGKTGTSQVVKMRDTKGQIPYQYRDHALFVAFAPYEHPEVAVAVVVEHGEHGGSAAAPISAKILKAYFEKKGVIKRQEREEKNFGDDSGEKSAPTEETKRAKENATTE